jgi:hypothetical protein
MAEGRFSLRSFGGNAFHSEPESVFNRPTSGRPSIIGESEVVESITCLAACFRRCLREANESESVTERKLAIGFPKIEYSSPLLIRTRESAHLVFPANVQTPGRPCRRSPRLPWPLTVSATSVVLLPVVVRWAGCTVGEIDIH